MALAEEILQPSSVVNIVGLSGGLTDIDEGAFTAGELDGNWMVATSNNTDTGFSVTFPAIAGVLFGQPGYQPRVHIACRQFDGGQSGTPILEIEWWQDGALLSTNTGFAVTQAGVDFFNILGGVELTSNSPITLVVKGLKSGGSPRKRNAVDFGSVLIVIPIDDAAPPTYTGYIKVSDGSVFTSYPIKVWTGSAWEIKPIKYWNGSSWITP